VHDERKPMLRVVRLPEGTGEPAPVSLDTGHALDDCLRRDGWIEDRERLRGCRRPVRAASLRAYLGRSLWSTVELSGRPAACHSIRGS